jgi:uncharacterized protein (DUF2141 family)
MIDSWRDLLGVWRARNPGEPTRASQLAAALAVALLGIVPAQAENGYSETATLETATLDLEVTKLESDEGVLVAVLLNSAQQYDAGDQFFRSHENVAIRDGRANVRFEGIPYGTYAVKVFHDENSNGRLDTNLIGFPKEGFGFSNDAMGSFGPPSFEQAAFAIEASRVQISITAN